MSVKRWAPVLMLVTLTGCTVTTGPEVEAGVSASPSVSGSGVAGCPFTEARGQEYEPETGRIKLVNGCLNTPAAGAVFRTAATAQRADGFTEGVPVAVLCIDFNGESYRDVAGYASKIWFKIDGEFTAGDGQGYVPHAATGYAAINAEDAC